MIGCKFGGKLFSGKCLSLDLETFARVVVVMTSTTNLIDICERHEKVSKIKFTFESGPWRLHQVSSYSFSASTARPSLARFSPATEQLQPTLMAYQRRFD